MEQPDHLRDRARRPLPEIGVVELGSQVEI